MSLILSIKFCIKKFKPLQKGGGGLLLVKLAITIDGKQRESIKLVVLNQ